MNNRITNNDKAAMISAFKTNQYTKINEGMPYDDTQSVYIPLDFLQDYIAYVISESQNQGLDVHGFNLYFGSYTPNDISADPELTGLEGRMTLVWSAAAGNRIDLPTIDSAGHHSVNP